MRIFSRHIALTAACTLAACDTTSAPEVTVADAALIAQPITKPRAQAALEALRARSSVPAEVRIVDGYPRTVTGRWATPSNTTFVERARAFLAAYDGLFRTNVEGFSLVVERVLPDDEGVVFQQLWHGVPVLGAELTVLFQRTAIIGTLGSLATEPLTLDPRPNIIGEDAATILRAHDTTPTHLPSATALAVLDARTAPGAASKARLVWHVTLAERGRGGFVDAHTGAIVQEWTTAHSIDPDAWDLQLEDANGERSETSVCYYFTTADEAAGDEHGVYASHGHLAEYQDLHEFAGRTWEFYLDSFGRDSYDDDGAQYEIFGSSSTITARWINDCGHVEFSTNAVGPDTMTHEMTHAVIRNSSDLAYHGESGAMNEMFADVMSALHNHNWRIGELSPMGALRDMSQPAHYSDWVSTKEDNGGVHANSAIGNYAFYLLTMGGAAPGVMVDGLGYTQAAKLAYAVMTKAPEDARYSDIQELSSTLAKSWGWSAQDRCDITNAWNAVGIGYADTDCNGEADVPVDWDLDGVPDDRDNCPRTANPAQTETLPADGEGDACDLDDDNDGVPDAEDNCGEYNPDQVDNNPVGGTLGDGIGDACQDHDGDKYLDEDDNCPKHYNPDQADADYDGVGDRCDYDLDGDRINDDVDNCLDVANHDQANADGDFFGDACDLCPNAVDEGGGYTPGVPLLGIPPKPMHDDSDHDGLGDACDPTPFGTVGNVLGDGTPIVIPNPSRGERFPATVDLSEGGVIYLDLPLCAAEPCAVLAYDTVLALDFNGLPDGVGLMVVDDFGGVVSQARNGGERTLRFTPRAARSYRLVLIGGVRASHPVSIRFYETTRHR